MVGWLAGKYPSLFDCVNQKKTPLHKACELGHLSVAKRLVELDAMLLRKKDIEKQAPLHFAAMLAYLEMDEWLAEDDPSLFDSASQDGLTPLHTACRLGNLSVANRLV